jgi:hypothetical protein
MNRLARSRRLVVVCITLACAGTVAAQDRAVGAAVLPAQVQAEQAMGALSAHYRHIWPALSPVDRQAFSEQERAWLNRGRWDEQKQCMARSPDVASDADVLAAQCQQQVAERRMQQLQSQRQAQSLQAQPAVPPLQPNQPEQPQSVRPLQAAARL